MLLVGHLNLKCASIWLGNENVKLTVFPVKLLHNWLAQLLVVHQLTCDYRPCFPGICDATNALLIYAVIWTFISNSVPLPTPVIPDYDSPPPFEYLDLHLLK